MPIELDTGGELPPIAKYIALGQEVRGGIVGIHKRQRTKYNPLDPEDREPIFKKNGKPSYELLVTIKTTEGTTAVTGKQGEEVPIVVGSLVRMIHKGGGFGNYIDASKALMKVAGRNVSVGDLYHGWCSDVTIYKNGSKIVEGVTDPEIVEKALEKDPKIDLGFYSSIEIDPPSDPEFLAECERLYHQAQASERIVLDASDYDDDDDYSGPSGGDNADADNPLAALLGDGS